MSETERTETTVDDLGHEYQELISRTVGQEPDETTAQRLAELEQQIVARLRAQAGPFLEKLNSGHQKHREAVKEIYGVLARSLAQAMRCAELLAGRCPEGQGTPENPPGAVKFQLASLPAEHQAILLETLEDRRAKPGFEGLRRLVATEERAIARLQSIMEDAPAAVLQTFLSSLALPDAPKPAGTPHPDNDLCGMLRRESQAQSQDPPTVLAQTNFTIH